MNENAHFQGSAFATGQARLFIFCMMTLIVHCKEYWVLESNNNTSPVIFQSRFINTPVSVFSKDFHRSHAKNSITFIVLEK